MNWLDILIVIFILLGALSGYYKGFILAFSKLASYILGFVGAFVFYKPFAEFLQTLGFDRVILKIIYPAIKLPEKLMQVPIQELSLVKVQAALSTMGVPAMYQQQMKELVQQLAAISKQAEVSTVGDALYYLIAGVVLKVIAFLSLVFIFEVSTSIIVKLLAKAINFSPAAILDHGAGLVFGIAKNCLGVAVLIIVVAPVLSLGTLNDKGFLGTLSQGVQGSQISTYVLGLIN